MIDAFTKAETTRLNAIGFIVPGPRSKADMMAEVVHYEDRKRGKITQAELKRRLDRTKP